MPLYLPTIVMGDHFFDDFSKKHKEEPSFSFLRTIWTVICDKFCHLLVTEIPLQVLVRLKDFRNQRSHYPIFYGLFEIIAFGLAKSFWDALVLDAIAIRFPATRTLTAPFPASIGFVIEKWFVNVETRLGKLFILGVFKNVRVHMHNSLES